MSHERPNPQPPIFADGRISIFDAPEFSARTLMIVRRPTGTDGEVTLDCNGVYRIAGDNVRGVYRIAVVSEVLAMEFMARAREAASRGEVEMRFDIENPPRIEGINC